MVISNMLESRILTEIIELFENTSYKYVIFHKQR